MPACKHFGIGPDKKTLDERVSGMKGSSNPAKPAPSKIRPGDLRRAICDCGRKCNILYKLKLIHYFGLGFLGAINLAS